VQNPDSPPTFSPASSARDAADRETGDRETGDREGVDAPGRNALVVEDNDLMAHTMRMMLESLGYTVRYAPTARQALNLLDAGTAVDLAISDIVMPGEMNGLAFAKIMRERRPDVPVVLTTGYSEAAYDAFEEGFTLLVKPFPMEQLKAVLVEIASQAGRR
jgi:CheY-like chemotaxis protein